MRPEAVPLRFQPCWTDRAALAPSGGSTSNQTPPFSAAFRVAGASGRFCAFCVPLLLKPTGRDVSRGRDRADRQRVGSVGAEPDSASVPKQQHMTGIAVG